MFFALALLVWVATFIYGMFTFSLVEILLMMIATPVLLVIALVIQGQLETESYQASQRSVGLKKRETLPLNSPPCRGLALKPIIITVLTALALSYFAAWVDPGVVPLPQMTNRPAYGR